MDTEEDTQVIDDPNVEPNVDPNEGEPSGGFDMDALKATIETTMQSMKPEPQQQAAPQMTQEEINKHLNVYDPSDDLASRMHAALTSDEFSPADLRAVLTEFANGLSKQHTTYAELFSQKSLNDFSQQIQPQLTAAQEVQQERREKAFFKDFPALEPFKKFLPQVSAQVMQSGVQFKTTKEANAAVAKAAEELFKSVDPKFSLEQAKKQEGKPAGVTFPGSAGGKAPAKPKGNAASIW